MEKVKRTIVKLFAVISVAVALLLCGALLGCGEKKPQTTGGMINPSLGIFLKAEMQEEEEYDIDNVSMDLLCGVDIDNFKSRISENGHYAQNYKDFGVYYCTYNFDDFIRKDKYEEWERFSYGMLYENLKTLEEGQVRDGAFLIEDIPYRKSDDYPYWNIDNLKGTEYEGTVSDDPYRITCYNRRTVNFPRELFTADEGRIYVSIIVGGVTWSDDWGDVFILVGESGRGDYEIPVCFDYAVDGETVRLSNVKLGSNRVIDGTQTTVNSFTKSRFNVKQNEVIENEEISEQVGIEDFSEPRFTSISGQVTWIDDGGNSHPAQYVKVEARVYSEDTSWLKLGNSLEEYYTDKDGNFNIPTTEHVLVNMYGVTVLVYAVGENVTVSKYGIGAGTYVYKSQSIEPDMWNNSAHVDLAFDMSTQFGQALQISQAVITAARYAKEMNGNWLDPVYVDYPSNENICCYRGKTHTIYIISEHNDYNGLTSYASWDVIMHEYGHHVEYCLGLTDSNGEYHYGGNMASHFYYDSLRGVCDSLSANKHEDFYPISECKTRGITLAWAEGFATFFGAMAQNYFKNDLSNIRSVGDSSYDASNQIDGKNFELLRGYGEDSEYSIVAFLWDLFDDYKAAEPFDDIALSHEVMWDYVVTPHAKTLSEFVNYVTDKLPRDKFVELLSEHSLNVSMNSMYSDDRRPIFYWRQHSDVPQEYRNNKFDVYFYNADKSLLFSRTGVRTNSITLTDGEWLKLLEGCDDFYWTVDAYQLDDDKDGSCLTGPYISELNRHGKICESIEIGQTKSGSVAGGLPFYRFSSDKYVNTKITLTCSDNLSCDVYTMPLVYSLNSNGNVHGSGSGTVVLYYEHIPSSWTSYIRVSGDTGAFTIKIEEHTHAYSTEITPHDETNHKRTCVCGSRSLEAHSFGKAVQMDSSNHKFTCACGYVKTAAHSFVTVGNRRRCLACGYSYLKPPGQDIMSVGDLC